MDDFDADGLLDIVASSWGLEDQIRYLRNQGDGTFDDRTEAAGLLGQVGGLNICHADYDNDGLLDILILRTLVFGSQHGQHIARMIQQSSDDVLLVDHGSLYPALQRLEKKKLIKAAWGVSSNNRKARFYELTSAGRKQFAHQTREWQRLVQAMSQVLGLEGANG